MRTTLSDLLRGSACCWLPQPSTNIFWTIIRHTFYQSGFNWLDPGVSNSRHVVVGRRVSISVSESDESTTSGQHRRRVSDVIRFERRVGVWLFGPRLPLDHDYVQGCKCGHGRWISGATDEDVRLIGEAIAAEAIRARVEFPESPAIPLEPQNNATETPLEKGWGRLSWRKVKYFNHLTGGADGTRTRDPRRDRPVF